MSTQTYTANPGTTNQHVTNQHVTSPSRRRRWILAVAAVVTVAFAALALALWHGQSSVAPATNGRRPPRPSRPSPTRRPSTPRSRPGRPSTPRSRPRRPPTPPSRPLPRHRAARAEAPRATR